MHDLLSGRGSPLQLCFRKGSIQQSRREISGLGFRASGSRSRVSGSGFGSRVAGSGFRESGSGFRVSGFGIRVSDLPRANVGSAEVLWALERFQELVRVRADLQLDPDSGFRIAGICFRVEVSRFVFCVTGLLKSSSLRIQV